MRALFYLTNDKLSRLADMQMGIRSPQKPVCIGLHKQQLI